MEAHDVIPAKAGIQAFEAFQASRFHRDNGDADGVFLKLTALGPTPARIIRKSEECPLIQRYQQRELLTPA